MSVHVNRAFTKMRGELAANAAILKRLAEIDNTLILYRTCCARHQNRRDGSGRFWSNCRAS
jgi:hypothetical protein